MSIYILAIESSCDDTSAAVLKNDTMLSNITANQDVHSKYGGVIPELASRAHQQNIIPVVDTALKTANINKKELSAVAFTSGPGLMGSLLVGVSFAKSFSMALNIPMIEINHMQAHILAHFIKQKEKNNETPSFPFLCLTVSGGHTQIVKVNDFFDMEIIGKTIDDAAGEAFDKAAKIMGLPYPGGPVIDKLAKEGNYNAFSFAKPKISNYNYSFSGLKTSFLYFLRDKLNENSNFINENINDLSASFQYAVVETLMGKLEKAANDFNIKTIAIAGGVSANSHLRNEIIKRKETKGWKTFIPEFQFTTDNAAMIGIAGYYKYLKKEFTESTSTPYSR